MVTQRSVITGMKSTDRKIVNCSLAWSNRLSESYVVKYWEKKDDNYMRQVSQLVYSINKHSHERVEQFVMDTFRVSKNNIVSVTYQ